MPRNGEVITVKAISGHTYQYVWTDTPSAGAMKEVYFAPDKSYVVAYFKEPQDANAVDRLQNLVGTYRQGIFVEIIGKRFIVGPATLYVKQTIGLVL